MESGGKIFQSSDNGYIIAGGTSSSDGEVSGFHGGNGYDVLLIKISNNGTIQWQKCYGGTDYDYICNIHQTSDGGYIFGSSTYSNDGDVLNNNFEISPWVVKLSSTGTIQWQKFYGLGYMDEFQPTADGSYVFAGASNDTDMSVNHGNGDAWVVKLSAMGSLQWQRYFGGTQEDYATSIKPTNDGGYIFSGSSSSNDGDVTGNHGGIDTWLVKF